MPIDNSPKYIITIEMSSNKLKLSKLTNCDILTLLPYLACLSAIDYRDSECPFTVEIEVEREEKKDDGKH